MKQPTNFELVITTIRNIRNGFTYQLAGDPMIPPDLFAAADLTALRSYRFPGLPLRERLRIGQTRLARQGFAIMDALTQATKERRRPRDLAIFFILRYTGMRR